MSSFDEAVPQDELRNSAPASPRITSHDVNDTGEPSSPETSSDKHGKICNMDEEPPADEITADQYNAELASSEHSAVALESQQRSTDLCRYCQKIVNNLPYLTREGDDRVVEHHDSEAGLFDSARAGCLICTQSLEARHPCHYEFRLEDGCWKNALSMLSIPAASGESRPPGIASSLNATHIPQGGRYHLIIYTPIPDQVTPINDAIEYLFEGRHLDLHQYKGTMEKDSARRWYPSRTT